MFYIQTFVLRSPLRRHSPGGELYSLPIKLLLWLTGDFSRVDILNPGHAFHHYLVEVSNSTLKPELIPISLPSTRTGFFIAELVVPPWHKLETWELARLSFYSPSPKIVTKSWQSCLLSSSYVLLLLTMILSSPVSDTHHLAVVSQLISLPPRSTPMVSLQTISQNIFLKGRLYHVTLRCNSLI